MVLPVALFSILASSASAYPVVPRPEVLVEQPGAFVLDSRTAIAVTPQTRALGEQLRFYLRPATGYPFRLVSHPGPHTISLLMEKPGSIPPEGYKLDVRADGIEIRAASPAGLFYGIQTLRQLAPPAVFSKTKVRGVTWSAPCVHIEDHPRFSWRGAHIDLGRHFMPKEFLFKMVDLLAMHKMNVFHLHLTEDQGWRIEIKKYPRLTQVGSIRKNDLITDNPERFTGKPHGGYYTQDDLRKLVAYARPRFVTIMPEIEMPGHAQAAIAAYPELGNTGKPVEVSVTWGIHTDILNAEDSTVRFFQDVLSEVMGIFPSTYIHVGGDEAHKDQWRISPAAQRRIKELGLKNEEELQSWFIKQMDTFLSEHGRRLVGWDEILEGGLARGAIVMSWRGEAGGVAAVKAGHDVVMAPYDWTYLDQTETKDPALELPLAWGNLTMERLYGYEPVPAGLAAEESKHVLGAESALWTEGVPDPKAAEYQLFPRLCAMAEVLWSPKAGRDYDAFRARMDAHVRRLDLLNVKHHPMQNP